MNFRKMSYIFSLLSLILFASCSGSSSNRSGKEITSFSILDNEGVITGTEIAVTVPYGTNVTSLTPTITISGGATVSPASGVAQNFANPVIYTVTAGDGSTQAYTVTVVSSGDVTLDSISVTPANPSVPNGTTRQFTATGTYSDGTTADITSSVTWASSDTDKATIVSTTGLATAVAASGTSTISATHDLVSGNTTLTATAAVLASIAVTPADSYFAANGGREQFTATATFSDTTTMDFTDYVNWTSSNPIVVFNGAAGLAASEGATEVNGIIITATEPGTMISGSTSVDVATIQSINIDTPGHVTHTHVDETIQFTAIGVYHNHPAKDITATVTWSSASPSIATIGANTGLATGVSIGFSAITATEVIPSSGWTLNVNTPD